jgi:hypothetical protein
MRCYLAEEFSHRRWAQSVGNYIQLANVFPEGTCRSDVTSGFDRAKPALWMSVAGSQGPSCISGRDRGDQRLDPHDVDDPGQIVGQDRKRLEDIPSQSCLRHRSDGSVRSAGDFLSAAVWPVDQVACFDDGLRATLR